MSDQSPQYTHFSTFRAELPSEYYEAMGRAFYQWSQLETVVCSLAASLLGIPWLEAIARLRGSTGFKVKNVFEQLLAELRRKGDGAPSKAAIEKARDLYAKRNEFFHSVWGDVYNDTSGTVGIQEWSNTEYANFRPVGIEELRQFADDCRKVQHDIGKTAFQFLHGGTSFTIDDVDGLVRVGTG
jgi:hypothetical protein